MQSPITKSGRDGRALQVVSALRNRNYRIYWLGFLSSIIGWQIQTVGIAFFVFERTGSELSLGIVSGSQAGAGILFSVLGGVIADRVERRRLLMIAQVGALSCTLTLATLVAVDVVQIWQIAAIAFVFGAFQAFDQPSRAALVPQLVDRKDLSNAVALTSAVYQASAIIGPSIAGLLIAFASVSVMFYVAAFGFVGFMVALLFVKVSPPAARTGPTAGRRGIGTDLVAGLAYIRRSSLFTALISLAFLNAFFGLSFIVLLPVFAKEELAVGAQGFGLLFTAIGIGALAGTMIVAALGEFSRKGLLILGGAVLFVVLLILFSLSSWLAVSLALLVAIGLVRSLYMTSAMTLLQLRVDDAYRGRVTAVYGLQWSLMPLGGLQAGLIAEAWGAPVAVAFGGCGVVFFTLLVGLRQRELRQPLAPAPD